MTDCNGRPAAVFHGTDAEFDRFDFSLSGNPDSEGGPFFTDCREIAQDYGGRVVEAYIRITNPIRLTYAEWLNDHGDVAALRAKGFDGFVVTDFSSNGLDEDADEDFADTGTVYVPFVSPEQIRINQPMR